MNNIFNVIAGGCSGTCTCIWDSYLSAWECSADDPSACSMGCGCQTPPNYTGGSTTVQTSCYDPTIPTATPEPATPAPTATPAPPTATPSPSSTASPATPAPTSPPATPAPTSAPATPAPTSPPATPVPSSTVAPATPAPTTPPATPSPSAPSTTSPPSTPVPTRFPCSYCSYEDQIHFEDGKFVKKYVKKFDGCVDCDAPCPPSTGGQGVTLVFACGDKQYLSNGCDGCNWYWNPAKKMFQLADQVNITLPLEEPPKTNCENCGGCANPPSPDEYLLNGNAYIHSECGDLPAVAQPFEGSKCGLCAWSYANNSFKLEDDNCSEQLCNPMCVGCYTPAEWYAGQEEILYEIVQNPGNFRPIGTGCKRIPSSDVTGYIKEYPKNIPDSGQCECTAELQNGTWKYSCQSYNTNPCKNGCNCDPQVLWDFFRNPNQDPEWGFNGNDFDNTLLPCRLRGDANDKIIIPCSCGNTTQVPEGLTSKTGEGKWMGLVGERTSTGGSYQNDQLQTYVNENGSLVVRKFALGQNVNMTPTEFGESFDFIKKIETSQDLPPI